ncbi:MAG: RIP metalloprotease [Dehalococcoidia bacterium]
MNLLPFGGFVRMLGEEDPGQPRSLASKGVGTRFLVLSAGSIMMFLLPFVLFPLSFMIPQEVVVGGEGVKVYQVAPNSPALRAGIESGDIILSINDQPIRTIDQVREVVGSNRGSEITILLQKASGTQEAVSVIPRVSPPPGQGALGVSLGWVDPIVERKAYSPWKAIALGPSQYWQMLAAIKDGIASIVTGRESPAVVGIVGIAQVTGQIAERGVSPLLVWASFLSINLAIINLFPIPALDGGRLVFVALEALRRGKRISPKREGMVHLIGFAVLIALILLVSYYDIMRIVRGESLFP